MRWPPSRLEIRGRASQVREESGLDLIHVIEPAVEPRMLYSASATSRRSHLWNCGHDASSFSLPWLAALLPVPLGSSAARRRTETLRCRSRTSPLRRQASVRSLFPARMDCTHLIKG